MQDKTATITPLLVCVLVNFPLLSLYLSSNPPVIFKRAHQLSRPTSSYFLTPNMPHGSLMPPRFSLASAMICITYMTTVLND
jgi:hypothetical protein